MRLHKNISNCFITPFFDDYIENLKSHNDFRCNEGGYEFYHISGQFKIVLENASGDIRYMGMLIVHCPISMNPDFKIDDIETEVGALINVPKRPFSQQELAAKSQAEQNRVERLSTQESATTLTPIEIQNIIADEIQNTIADLSRNSPYTIDSGNWPNVLK